MITIRPALPADAEAIVQVDAESTSVSYKGLVSDALLELSHAQTVCPERIRYWADLFAASEPKTPSFVALENGKIVGFVGGEIGARDSLEHDAQMGIICVLSVNQGRGVGKLLAKALADALVNAGARNMLVWSLKGSRACGFYEKIGGVRVNEKPLDWNGTMVQVVAYSWPDLRLLNPL